MPPMTMEQIGYLFAAVFGGICLVDMTARFCTNRQEITRTIRETIAPTHRQAVAAPIPAPVLVRNISQIPPLRSTIINRSNPPSRTTTPSGVQTTDISMV
jgi:hypothetical protein